MNGDLAISTSESPAAAAAAFWMAMPSGVLTLPRRLRRLLGVLASDGGSEVVGLTGRDDDGDVLLLLPRRVANSTSRTPDGIRAEASRRAARAFSACSNSTTAQIDVKMSP